MKTEIVQLQGNLQKIGEAFKKGPVAFPTETVYGLGALACREDLIKKVFEVKNRPNDNPLIIHVSSLEMLKRCISGDIPDIYTALINEFWPGPLTLLFKRNKSIPDSVTAGGEFVAIRMPNHKDTLVLIDYLDEPIVGPSANRSTRPSPTTAEHVLEDLDGRIEIIIDGGSCIEGVESTVVNGLSETPLLLRSGVISYESIKKFVPEIKILLNSDVESSKLSPGTRYKHYSPTAEVFMIRGTSSEIIEKLKEIKEESVGFLIPEEYIKEVKIGSVVYSLGNTVKTAAQKIFDGLRYLDRYVSKIYTVELESAEEGRAVMDRLNRAASRSI